MESVIFKKNDVVCVDLFGSMDLSRVRLETFEIDIVMTKKVTQICVGVSLIFDCIVYFFFEFEQFIARDTQKKCSRKLFRPK